MGDDFLFATPRPKAPATKAPVKKPEAQSDGSRSVGNDHLSKTGNPKATDFGSVTMAFDGEDLVVLGDGKEVFRFGAQSGRPVRLTAEDAEKTGANPATATYMNDKRFVGVKDYGPIPEGTYAFAPASIENFDFGEQLKLTLGGVVGMHDVDVHGRPIHAGDWGSGRVALNPQGRLRPGPPGVGDVYARNGFFLHGGILSGSSGCIDVGGGFSTIVDFLAGYTKPIRVTVQYRNDPPVVNFFQGTSGALAYSRAQLLHGPSLGLGLEFGRGEKSSGTRALTSVGYDLVLQWAGGALTAGARLDVPFDDKEAFVRAGLTGGLDFRIFRPLYGRIFGGYSWDLGGDQPKEGAELGGGLRLDLNRIQLEALYNVLRPTAEADQQVKQAFVRLGFRF